MVMVGALEAITHRHAPPSSRTSAASAATPPHWRRPACAACSPSRSATARTCSADVAGRSSPRARRRGSRRSCATRACSASTTCSRTWHGKNQGRISVFPAAGARRDLIARAAAGRPRLRREARPRLHDPPVAEPRRGRLHGQAPRHAARRRFSPSTASSARGCSRRTAATSTTPTSRCSASRGTIVSHQAGMAANRGVIPPIPALRAAGCPIANGTDNNTNDLFEVMRIALLTERIRARRCVPRRAAAARRHARGRHAGRRARPCGRRRRSARSRSARRPTSSCSTRSASTSCRRGASSRRGSTTASRPTSSR